MVFGLLTKIKKVSGTSFSCKFSAWSFNKSFPYLNLYQLTKFQYHTCFPSDYIKQSVSLSSYLDNWWRHKHQNPQNQCTKEQKKK